MGMASGQWRRTDSKQGLLFLNTDGRYEANKLEVIKACFLHNEIEVYGYKRSAHSRTKQVDILGKQVFGAAKMRCIIRAMKILPYTVRCTVAFESGKYETPQSVQ